MLAIDLFAGAGGMSLGFERAGFEVVGAFENDVKNTTTYQKNFPNTLAVKTDLARSTGQEIRNALKLSSDHEITVVFGGPPCQAFSSIGRRRSDDDRRSLIQEFARISVEISSEYIVMENVEGLTHTLNEAELNRAISILESGGYNVVRPLEVLDAQDYGVPQRRRRLFVLAYKQNKRAPAYPLPLENNMRVTVDQAIGDLPDVDRYDYLIASGIYDGDLGTPSVYASRLREWRTNGQFKIGGLSGCQRTNHSITVVDRFASTRPGDVEQISRYSRLVSAGVSPTLRAGTDTDRGSYTAWRPIHPDRPRCITVREAARLHSFPDWFEFHPVKWHAYRQIGNSVPPILAGTVADQIMLAKEARTNG